MQRSSKAAVCLISEAGYGHNTSTAHDNLAGNTRAAGGRGRWWRSEWEGACLEAPPFSHDGQLALKGACMNAHSMQPVTGHSHGALPVVRGTRGAGATRKGGEWAGSSGV
jgi:hypothetical protein